MRNEVLTRAVLDAALAKQSADIEKLFDVKMGSIVKQIEITHKLAEDNDRESRVKFAGIDRDIFSLRLTRARMFGIATGVGFSASVATTVLVLVIQALLRS